MLNATLPFGCRSLSFAVRSLQFVEGNGMEEVAGSIPTWSTYCLHFRQAHLRMNCTGRRCAPRWCFRECLNSQPVAARLGGAQGCERWRPPNYLFAYLYLAAEFGPLRSNSEPARLELPQTSTGIGQ